MRTGNPVVLIFLFKELFPSPGDNNSLGFNAMLYICVRGKERIYRYSNERERTVVNHSRDKLCKTK